MQFLKDFKDFALKGNVVDLAVGVIIGTAFGKIVSSLVGDVIMPLIGGLLKMVDLTKLSYVISASSGDPKDAVIVAYGKFLQVTLDFVIIAATVFLMISLLNKALKKPMKEVKAPPEEILLLKEIRDALVEKKAVAEVAEAVVKSAKKSKSVSKKK